MSVIEEKKLKVFQARDKIVLFTKNRVKRFNKVASRGERRNIVRSQTRIESNPNEEQAHCMLSNGRLVKKTMLEAIL